MADDRSYGELLRDPRWQRKRLEIMERDAWSCRECGDKETTLNVHHLSYVRGRRPWEYDDDMLLTVCEGCHVEITKLTGMIRTLGAGLDLSCLHLVMGFMAGLYLCHFDGNKAEAPISADAWDLLESNADAFLGAGTSMGVGFRGILWLKEQHGMDLRALVVASRRLFPLVADDQYEDVLP